MSGEHYAKICPVCGTGNKDRADKCRDRQCRHVFTGNELGAWPKDIRMEVESQVLTDAQIESRLAALPVEAPDDPAAHRKEVEYLRREVLSWAAVGVIGAIILAAAWYAVVQPSLTAGKWPSDGLTVGLVAYGSIFVVVVVISAPVQIASTVLWYFRRPQYTSPDKVAETFYSELGLRPGKLRVGRAWVCLDPTAQTHFRSIEALQDHWRNQLYDLKDFALQATEPVWSDQRPEAAKGELACEIKWGPLNTSRETDSTAVLHRDLLLEVYDTVVVDEDSEGDTKGRLVYTVLVLPQSKTLLKGGDRWYLTSGTLDSPEASLSPAIGNRLHLPRDASGATTSSGDRR